MAVIWDKKNQEIIEILRHEIININPIEWVKHIYI
jgi:hypothetical protein